ncbi:MAG: hypothetical protein L6461_20435 [Anaerolineae bacterium]|nr:hypothetical protein [Anaerolineae bacterium]
MTDFLSDLLTSNWMARVPALDFPHFRQRSGKTSLGNWRGDLIGTVRVYMGNL